jgi:hypothetical protein
MGHRDKPSSARSPIACVRLVPFGPPMAYAARHNRSAKDCETIEPVATKGGSFWFKIVGVLQRDPSP